MSVILMFTDEELERISFYRSSSPGIQRVILEVIRAVAEMGETDKVRKKARNLFRMLKRG